MKKHKTTKPKRFSQRTEQALSALEQMQTVATLSDQEFEKHLKQCQMIWDLEEKPKTTH